MLPCLHSLGCRMQPDESSRSVSGTTSGSILLFDAEEIQDVQSVANPSRTLPDTPVLQFGDSTSLAEDGGVSAYLFPASASFQASLQAEASAQVSSGSAEKIQDVQSVANPSRNLPDTTVLQFGDPASFAEGGGVSAYFVPTSASFQASLQAEASAQVSSGSAERIQDVQSVANPSRNLPGTTVLQFGDSASLAEDGGVSPYLFPASASFQASLQAEASAQVSSGYVMFAYAADESAAQGRETASAAAISVNAENTDLKRMYRCSTCGLSFIGIHGIMAHTRRSACGSIENKKCMLCDFQCETYEDLDKHGELVHKGSYEYMYICPLCNKGFKRRKRLTVHHRYQHR